jgi:hypothetical protein
MTWAKTIQVSEAIRSKYAGDSYAVFEEIKPSVGMDGRKLDFLVMNLWRSRGLRLEGIEVKTDRRDWLRELREPEKQEGIFVFCDNFWLATSDDKVATLDEIPETWGWMVLGKSGAMKTRKKPPRRKGKALTRAFVAEILRHETKAREAQIREALRKERDEVEQKLKDNNYPEYAAMKHSHDELVKRVRNFEECSGLTVGQWSRPSIGVAVRTLEHIQRDVFDPVDRMQYVLNMLDNQRQLLVRAIEQCREVVPALKDTKEES